MSHDPLRTLIAALDQNGFDPQSTGPDSWESRCPGHDGDRRNLTITKGDDGKVLVCCQAHGCEAAAIVQAVGLTMADLFPPRDATANGRPQNGKVRARPGFESPRAYAEWFCHRHGYRDAAAYAYRDRDGSTRYAVYRFDAPGKKKEYRPIHLDPKTRKWLPGDPPGKLPLYRLHELTDARRVFLVEGEKCTNLVRDIGLTATTTAHGAKSPHKTDLSPLAGTEVIILPDVGEAGESYARVLLRSLAGLDPPPTVRVLRLQGLMEDGDDVEQWLQSVPEGWEPEQCRAELERLADEAPAEDLSAVNDKKPAPKRRTGKTGKGEEPSTLDDELADYPTTDLGNARRLVARHGQDIRYCHPWKRWLVWDGRRLRLDDTGEIHRRGRKTARAILIEAAAIAEVNKEEFKELMQWQHATEKRDRLTAMIALAEAEDGIPILPKDLNTDPWLFNCFNGTIDLKTGQLLPHRRDDLITQLCPHNFDPLAPCPLWDATLAKFFHRTDPAKQDELINYWRRLCGCALVGEVRDHILAIAYGTGSNGKSTIFGGLLYTFGPDYAMKAPPGLLMAKKHESHPTEQADLFGKRLVLAIETESGRRLNETLVKELTGGDRIRARRMKEDFWEFDPTHTAFMSTNHRPVVHGTDRGIWRRLKLIPFTVSVSDKDADKTMPAKLRAEAPGILAWCVQGCLEWQRRGLDAPDEVTEVTEKYRRNQDLIGQFLEEYTISGPGTRVKASKLYARYKAWAEAGGENIATQTAFGLEISERGFEKITSNGIWYLGMALRDFGEAKKQESAN